ncbi:peptidase M61 [Flavobacterium limnosediminis JC2902]|uniref:Peptidase M61 n=1 Tax=Flavobacterium limnosediminis JC2902 TaxID=1341181 RepID=V6SIA6_9FLAO|nr:peptidase M61 [Flavobacterium limnosediminis]ESU26438.1 peptidase M61 [Flavobacterium limnosediminis JC2902]
MKKIICSLALATVLISCKTAQSTPTINDVNVAIDLVNVVDDKVMVTITPPAFTTETVTFHIPKTVPGTYSADNYGRFIEDVKAFDAKGNPLTVTKADENSWTISDAKKISKVTYLVNDSFDTETSGGMGGKDVFSPAGTNIAAGENFMLNTHGFVGYFEGKSELPYKVTISHPANLWGATSLTDTDASADKDVFTTPRYAELVDHPIMYSKPDYTTFKVDDMEILISVYSPNGTYKAADITPAMETMMRAQKKFLGPVNATKKYSVLLYLSDMKKADAKGFGALEHTTSTTVVMPEMMPKAALLEQLKDVVSHEFFHIVTPLTVHSKEIQYFDFNKPEMSEHLWMYEGVTEYFANLFQVNQGLISEEDFYNRMAEKIDQSKSFNEKMPFTVMSKNILEKDYKDSYYNVYLKGALIAMCIDIQMRESSNGEKGILDLMHALSSEYGSKKPFNDNELFTKITSLTYPAVGEFLKTYVAGETPIPYDQYFAKMGVTNAKVKKAGNPFLKDQSTPYITVDPTTKEIKILPEIELNKFMTSLGIKNDDTLLAINDTNYNLDNIYDLIMLSSGWKEGDAISVKIKRAGKEQILKGKITLPMDEVEGYQSTDNNKSKLKEAWLKG